MSSPRLARLPALLMSLLLSSLMPAAAAPAKAADKKAEAPAFDVKAHYTKYEYRIPMRDGTRLFTVVYAPKDSSKTYPFLMVRTPYSVGVSSDDGRRYGVDQYGRPGRHLGPSEDFDKSGYFYVFQDVRGRYMSEGKWLEMTPHRDLKKTPADVDESSDMHDTVDWLLKNVPNNNGRVGLWGISYPGFYTAASIIDSHPAIRAASPQAPIADLYMGDDAYHGGAFMLAANFGFYAFFKPQQNPTPGPRKPEDFDYGTRDGYEYFLRHPTLASLSALFKPEQRALWDDQVAHDTYDDYWQARAIALHLRNIHCAVMTVGGWFDAEDLQGPFTVSRTIAQNNPGIENALVVGPWVHGGWQRLDGHRLGSVDFADNTADYYRKNLLFPFFERHLKDAAGKKLPAATVFETGTNVWREYDRWPPKPAKAQALYFGAQGALTLQPPKAADAGFDEYRSDPAKPVPFVGYTTTDVPQEYMVADQRFAATRPDVLVYQTPPLEQDVTLAGPVEARLFVSTTGTDADWIVKLIDVYPPDYPDTAAADDDEDAADDQTPKDVAPPSITMAGYQQLVRGEPLRGKFRNGFITPQPFVPGQPEAVNFTMPDINHSFRRGHRIMVQLQSSWFPLIDRNPQVFMRIPDAKPEDFRAATQRVYRSEAQASSLRVQVLGDLPAALAAKP